MAYQHKDGNGSLFKNENKTKDTQPDYKGSATIDGKPKSVAAWIKENASGKYLSLKVEDVPVERGAAASATISEMFPASKEDDGIPF